MEEKLYNKLKLVASKNNQATLLNTDECRSILETIDEYKKKVSVIINENSFDEEIEFT